MAKRELIEPHKSDKRYARRDEGGQFTTQPDNVSRALPADRRKKAAKGRTERPR
jgi:hypothetical protein